MAISHQIQSLVLLLLVSLFFLPALVRSVNFKECPPIQDLSVKVKSVTISPDSYNKNLNRTGTMTIYALSPENIRSDEVIVTLEQVFNWDQYIKEYPLCSVTKCPVKPGPLILTFTDVFSFGPKSKPAVEEDFLVKIREKRKLLNRLLCVYYRLWPRESLGGFSA